MVTKYDASCPKCGSGRILKDLEVGEEVCGDCGLVVTNEIYDVGPEWRSFDSTEQNSRARTGVGMKPALFDMGLSTSFITNRDASGKLLDYKIVNKMNRLQKYDNRSKVNDSQSRNLSIALPELDRVSTTMNLPKSVQDFASRIYRKALAQDMIRGRSIDSFVAACIYATCRLQGIPRALKTISLTSNRDLKDVARTYRLLIRGLNLKMPLDDSFKFITSISSKLELKRDTEKRAVEILSEAKEKQGLTGKEPRGVAAAALYMACLELREHRTQKQVAKASGTTEVTLRNRMRGLEKLTKNRFIDMPYVESYISQ